MAVKTRRARRTRKDARAVVHPSSPDLRAIEPQRISKTADNKGRVVLGELFANRVVTIEKVNDTEVIVKAVKLIPDSEAWLYENPEALSSVRTGLAQVKAGKVTPGPNVASDAELLAQLED